MAVTDGVVSLKHLVTMETLSNEEVLGLIRRGVAFKTNKANFSLDRQYLQQIFSLNRQRVRISLLKSLKGNLDWMSLNLTLKQVQ